MAGKGEGQLASCQRGTEKRREQRRGAQGSVCVLEAERKGGEEEPITKAERMSVAGKTKGRRLCTVLCCAESVAQHSERRGQSVTKIITSRHCLWINYAMQNSFQFFCSPWKVLASASSIEPQTKG